MKPSQTQVFLFDGERKAVQDRVNEFLRLLGRDGAMEPEIVGFAYNYQGPEYDGRTPLDGSASYGLLLIAHYPTINEMRAARGYDPVHAQPGASPMGDDIKIVPLDELGPYLRSLQAETAAPGEKPGFFARWRKRLFGARHG